MIPRRLRHVSMHVSTRCDQACAHCGIWKGNRRASSDLTLGERGALLQEARSLGAESVLFTGGEPFLNPNLKDLCETARGIGLRVQVATNGLAMGRERSWLGRAIDEIYVSIEGPEALHELVRGERSFARLRDSVSLLRAEALRPTLLARHVLTARSIRGLSDTLVAAVELGVDRLSLLPLDVASEAFGGPTHSRAQLLPSAEDVAFLRSEVERMMKAGWPSILMEDAPALRHMCDRVAQISAPRCNAPEWSLVIESDGTVRPCFFQPVFSESDGRTGLDALRRSNHAREVLRSLGKANKTCARCVCPKWIDSPFRAWTHTTKLRLIEVLT